MASGGEVPCAPPDEIELPVAPGVSVTVHRCTKRSNVWSSLVAHETYGLVFVRRGGFRRRARGRDDYVGPAMAFFEMLGAEDEVLHPTRGATPPASIP